MFVALLFVGRILPSQMARASIFIFFVLSRLLLSFSYDREQKYRPDCPPFPCGKLSTLRFPFNNSSRPAICGSFIVDGCSEAVQKIKFDIEGKWYEVTSFSQGNTISIRDQELRHHLQSRSCQTFNNLSLPRSPLFTLTIIPNITLFKCNRSNTHSSLPTEFSYRNCSDYVIFYNNSSRIVPLVLPPQCSIIHLPVKRHPYSEDPFSFLFHEFLLQARWSSFCVDCYFNGGRCALNGNGRAKCVGAELGENRSGLDVWIAISAVGIGVLIVLCCCFRGFLHRKFIFFWKPKLQRHQNIEAFLETCGSLAPKRYSYSEVKKMTNNFKEKLGQGGYGAVYKGALCDDHFVAVKFLNDSKGDGEEFINEVASISRTSHVNIVTLLGFCFEGHNRALIYDFMPNGSLERFIYGSRSMTDRLLGWETLYQIAVGIARGLEYLHRGCNIRIVHLDIKPHNILLDEEFCPKISDFGLAKLCTRKDSIVSVLGARGTFGYIAPEVCCRNFGSVSHKSDVYSYGMMVLEMVGGRKMIDVEVDCTSEIYFPQWIYKRVELGEELGLQGITNEEEKERAMKMIMVGLWCIQTDPSNRPPMGKVLDMLQGSLESLQIPSSPFLSDPSRTDQADS